MNIIRSIMTKNPCYKAGRKIKVKGLMLHSVGCPQPKASVFINAWNSASYKRACVHAFIDGNSGDIYQTLPWDYRGWHSGGSSNDTHLGVEMCEPASIKYTSGSRFTCSNLTDARACVKRTYQSAVELFAYLCKLHGLNPLADGVIVSHAEGHKRGIASNHGDPIHLWDGLGMGYTMNGFRQDVKRAMAEGSASSAPLSSGALYRVRKAWADSKSQKGAFSNLNNAKKCADKNKGYYVFDEAGKVIYPAVPASTSTSASKPSAPGYTVGKTYTTQVELKVRTGPGINYAAKRYSQLTTNAKTNDADKDGAINKGTVVTCKAIKKVGNDIWMQIPSGWIAAYYQREIFVK